MCHGKCNSIFAVFPSKKIFSLNKKFLVSMIMVIIIIIIIIIIILIINT